MSKKQTGFTLIEMMIVVIIIAILAAIAIPSYQHYVTRSMETQALSALQENALFMERINARFYGYTKTRDRSNRAAQVITTADLPVQALCTGSDCGRNYQFGVAVSNDLSQYILTAYPSDTVQARDSKCGAFIIDSSGGQFAKYETSGSYAAPTISESSYANPSGVYGGTDKSADCF